MIFCIGGGNVAVAEEYSFTITTSDFKGTSYAANNGTHTSTATCTTDNTKTLAVSWYSYQVMYQSAAIQWQKNAGYIYNTTDLGTIKSVTVNSTAGTFTTYYGTSSNPTSSTTVGNGYFTVKVGSATGKSSSVVVTFEVSDAPTATLTGISVTGTAAELWTGDDFTHDGIKVTATYDDNSEKDVTNSCSYSGCDMSTAGSQMVTVSYGEKTASYTVNVKTIGNTQENAYTASEAIEIIDAGKGLKTPVYVKGKVSEIASSWTENNGYLSFWVSEDGTENKFEMYKNYKGADNEVYTSEEECPKVGDDVICYGTLTKYITTDNTSYYVFSEGNYLVEKTTVVDNRTTTTVTFGEDVDDQTFNVNLGETFVGKTATVTPTEAGNVTYSSDNTEVASVDKNTGAITIGNTAGTATITASFAETATHKASSAKYYINVIDPNALVFYESFDLNDGTGGNDGIWSGFSATSNLKYDKSEWSVVKGYGANKCARFGIDDAKGSAKTPTIDLSGDKYILTFKAGAWNTKDEKTTIDIVISNGTLTYNGTTSKTQTIEMNKAEWTDYTMTIAGATNSTTIMFTAKVASNNRFFLDEVKIVKAPATSTLSLVAVDNNIYYATFSSSEDVIFPSNVDVEVDAVSVESSTLNINKLAQGDYFVKATSAGGYDVVSNGYYVPANTGVLIQSRANSATYYTPYKAAAVSLPANQLKAAPAGGGEFEHEEGHVYYKLAYNDYDAKEDLGFYWGAAKGGEFYVKAGTAYLDVPSTSGTANVKGFSFDGASTGVSAVDAEEPSKTRGIYNIAGQKVNAMTKAGLYIVNGKKIVIRK